MNRYSTPENNGLGNLQDHYCHDKKIICWNNALLARFLRLPVIYHFIDCILRLELVFAPVPLITNYTGSWLLGFSLIALCITVTFAFLWRIVYWSVCIFIVDRANNPNRLVTRSFATYVFGTSHVDAASILKTIEVTVSGEEMPMALSASRLSQ